MANRVTNSAKMYQQWIRNGAHSCASEYMGNILSEYSLLIQQ